jgi:hypothetical protein
MNGGCSESSTERETYSMKAVIIGVERPQVKNSRTEDDKPKASRREGNHKDQSRNQWN